MTIESVREFLGWCTAINLGILAITSIAMLPCRSWIIGLHGKMFGLDETSLNRAYFQYLANFKIAVIVFNLVPYLSLRIMLGE